MADRKVYEFIVYIN